MHKSLNSLYPEWLYFFPTVQSATNSVTRQQNNLVITKRKTDIDARAFLINGHRRLNSIPDDISNVSTLSDFRHKLFTHILQNTK